MTIKECIDIIDNLKPNQYSVKEKVIWLSFIDSIIINDVLKTHEGYDGRYDEFTGYSEEKTSVALIVPSPYDQLYPAYLKMKIDGENGETARYNNSAAEFNAYMMEYRKYYHKTHMPLDKDKIPTKKSNPSINMTDAMLDNLKRELYYLLYEDFAEATSKDKLYSIITEYAQNNIEMFKGKDGESIDEKTIEAIVSKLLLKGNKISSVTLFANQWKGTTSPYSQVVNISGVTKRSKIDLNPTVEQLSIFHNKDLAFVVGNNNGVVTVYAIGQKPTNDYTMQATITEVAINE